MATLQERIFIDASASSTLMSGGAKEPGLGAWDGVRVIVECFPILPWLSWGDSSAS